MPSPMKRITFFGTDGSIFAASSADRSSPAYRVATATPPMPIAMVLAAMRVRVRGRPNVISFRESPREGAATGIDPRVPHEGVRSGDVVGNAWRPSGVIGACSGFPVSVLSDPP